MPIVRDGQNKVHEFDMTPPPPEPPPAVVRDRVSEARMAEFAAERARMAEHDRPHLSLAEKARLAREREAESRARGAKAGGFVKGVAKPRGIGGHWAQKRAEKLPRVVDAIRATTNLDEAAEQLGMAGDALRSLVAQYRVDGTLPADVDEQIRTRSNSRPRRQRTPPLEEPAVAAEAPRERPTTELADTVPARPSSSGLRDDVGQHGASAAAEAPWHQEPCRSCLHRRVCSIRDEVQRIAEAIALTDVPPVVHLELSCGHYLPDVTVAS